MSDDTSKRKFTLRELHALYAADREVFVIDTEQISASRRAIYFEIDGKQWRIEAKTCTDGEDELEQSLCFVTRRGWDKFSEGETWDAEEVHTINVVARRRCTSEEMARMTVSSVTGLLYIDPDTTMDGEE